MEKINSYKDLIVWQKSILIAVKIYEVTDKFPREEIYGLSSQMRRAAVSIASNIAEGRNRGTRKDFVQFLRVALGSTAELETQIDIAKLLPKTKNLTYTEINSLIIEVTKMLNTMIARLSVVDNRDSHSKLTAKS